MGLHCTCLGHFRYLDDLFIFNIDKPYFEQMVNQIYLAEPQLN